MVTGLRKTSLRLFLLAALAGCASGKSGATENISPSSVISGDEITKSGFIDAFSTVQSLRPQWLMLHGQSSLSRARDTTIKVYLDGNLLGTTDNLRQITANSISSIRHLDGIEASNRYGLDHGAGAILVYSRK